MARYAAAVFAPLRPEFVEVETGRRSDRPVLAEALQECRRTGGTLAIAKLDRLARSVAFIANLMEARVPFVAVDMPAATPLMLHVMAAFAEYERDQISARTKAALAAAKARGVQLGAQGRLLASKHQAEAAAYAQSSAALVNLAKAEGITTLQGLADFLNEHSWPTRGGAMWSPTTARRLVGRLNPVAEETLKTPAGR